MGTPNPPSVIWGSMPSIPPAVDPPIQQDASFVNNPAAQRLFYAYQDSQIRGLETHVVQSLVGGLTGTWIQLDAQSAAVAVGQWVCMAGSTAQTATLAVLAALITAGEPLGIALTPGAPGSWIRIALAGKVPPSITGLLIGSNLYAVVNTSTGYTTSTATIGSNQYPVGTIDAAANLTVHIQLPPVSGSSGISITGTGFIPVVAGTIGSSARAVNLASNATNGDVTGVLAAINGGKLQGDLNVTNGSPGTFDATHQIAYCDTSTGTCSITFPLASVFGGSIPADWQLLVVDTAGVAATSNITVHPNGESAWNPTAGSFGTSSIVLSLNGIIGLWQWDANKSHWVLTSSGSGLPSGTGLVQTISGTASNVAVATKQFTDLTTTSLTGPTLGWQQRWPVFRVDSYATGTLGGSAGDDAALAAAIADAVAAGGGTIVIPVTASPLSITSEHTITVPLRIVGAGPGASLQAAATIRSFFRLQARCSVEDLTFLGANVASYALLFNGAAGTTVKRCDFQALGVNCFRSSAYQTAATISLVSDSGGGPSISLTQPYPLALMLGGNVYAKLTAGGALGTAALQISSDGISYSSVNQTLWSATPIGQPNPPHLGTDSGLTLVTTAGTFTNGRVLHWSVTPGTLAGNQGILVEHSCTANLCGLISATSGVFASFPGGPVVSTTGTASWTAGSPIVTIAGGVDLTTLNIRDGDAVYLPGAHFLCADPATPTRDVGTVALVLGPTQLYLDGNDLPQANGSASDFAIIVGGTAFTDPVTGPYNDFFNLQGQYLQQANGFRDGALNGGTCDAEIHAWGVCWYSGTESSD